MGQTALPDLGTQRRESPRPLEELVPRYHVILLDDQAHTYEYVIEMLVRLFQHSGEQALEMAREVDSRGEAVVWTANREQAEHKRQQIHAYGPDWRLPHSRGSMSARIEAAG